MEQQPTITQLNPDNFEFQSYISSDEQLIATSDLDTVFTQDTDYIEYFIYDENQNKIFPPQTQPLLSYNVKQGDVLLNPEQDLSQLGFDQGLYNILYSFYRKRLASDVFTKYFIKEISSDRTEIRLDSNIISNEDIISSTNEFINYREAQPYFVDFYLNFGDNQTIIANNIRLDEVTTEDPTVLIKLYNPLPEQFGIKDEVWVVEELAQPQLYQVNFPFNIIIEEDFEFISGPNYNIEVKTETGKSGQQYTYNTLLNTNTTSSINQLQNLLKTKEIEININYEDFSEFIHFSSAKTRLENFYYKAGLIESYTNTINNTLGSITSGTTSSFAYSSSIASFQSKIDEIIQNFDGYEYFLYFDSGSQYSWPKSNTEPPYTLYSTGSTEVLNWIGSADPGNAYFGGIALSASNYDQDNQDWLYFAIPEYLREDPENARYELFVDMVGQHYDNIWIYIKDITNKFNADNRLDYGISKDLVADAIRDFGVKLYSNNFNINDLYTAFLGLTPSGSLFPYPDQTNTLPTPNGLEYVDTLISASNDIIPLDDANKRLYKRIYHNLPYLLKTKGTATGLRALITSYGIPDTILRINEFGGKDRNNSQDWDLEQRVFNYAFDTEGTNYFSSSFVPDSNWNLSGLTSPSTIQFRFKTYGIPNSTHYSQSLWVTEDGDSALILEYTGSGLTSASYSGSIPDPENIYGTIKFIPDSSNPQNSASVYLPVFDGEWWSVMTTVDSSISLANSTSSLYVANRIDNQIGFSDSNSILGSDATYYDQSTYIKFPQDSNITIDSKDYIPFSGSYQEIRYYSPVISESVFYDYVMNPYSVEGNTTNSTPEELIFRADLGTQLDTGSRVSIHPRITGSISQITQSFNDGTSTFYISSSNFIPNVEKIYQDQVPSGIKNRITDKIQLTDNIMPDFPSGSNTDIQVLSPFQSIQQTSFVSQSYTPNVDYLEVAFSPQDQINDDINAQLGYFNLGDYIGDPRQISSSARNYPDLDALRDAYFNKYINSYDVVDFIRLIKFFDNSLFRMIKDFTPARTSLSSGVVVKQHLLERNRQRPAQASWSNETYSGSIKPQSRGYNTGSGDVGQYEFNDGSSIYRFSGGTGGSFQQYNGLNTSPSASAYGLLNQFGLTQSFEETYDGPLGPRTVTIYNQEEFYDGEFSGSYIQVTDQDLNPNCNPYITVPDTPIQYNPIFFNNTQLRGGTVQTEEWLNRFNSPKNGDAFILSEFNTIKYIKLARFDINGENVADYLTDSDTIKFIFSDGTAEYFIDGVEVFAGNVRLTINQTQGSFNITSSIDGGSEHWFLQASGSYSASNSTDLQSQGIFNSPNTNQTQYFQYWDGPIVDTLGFFNTGSQPNTHGATLDSTWYTNGTYNPKRTSNVPWIVTATASYSAFDSGISSALTASGRIMNGGVYGVVGGTDQTFVVSSLSPSGSFSLPTSDTLVNGVDMDTEYYNISFVDTRLPGFSGSGTTSSGNRQIVQSGTASLEWIFDELPISASGKLSLADVIPLSGSDNIATNDNFITASGFNPTLDSGTLSITGSEFISSSATQFGYYILDKSIVQTYYAIILDGAEFRATIKYQYPIDWTGDEAAAILQASTNFGSSWSDLDTQTLPNVNTPPTQVSGSVDLEYDYNVPPLFIPIPEDLYLRLAIRMPAGLNLEYVVFGYRGLYTYQDSGGSGFDPDPDPFLDFNYNQGLTSLNDTPSWNAISASGDGITLEYKSRLMYTGSDATPAVEITSSNIHSFNYTGPGNYTLDFPDSPIQYSNHANTSQSMYYVEYEFYTGSRTSATTILPRTSPTYPQVLATQSIDIAVTNYSLTGSLNLYKGNVDDTPLSFGDIRQSAQFLVNDSSSTGTVTLEYIESFPFDYNDAFRLGVSVNKTPISGLAITDYKLNIRPSQSILANIPNPSDTGSYSIPTLTDVVIPTYFGSVNDNILPFNLALNCQPLLNNYIDNRESTFLMDVDYTNLLGSLIPVNQQQILDNTATKAAVPDSNYTTLRSITPRYLGSKSTSKYINKWAIGDTGTFGKLPTIELRNAFFGYFDSIEDPYPNKNDVIKLNLNYLIDQQGNALPPSLEGISRDIFEKVFPIGSDGTLSIESGSKALKKLNSPYPLVEVGSYPTPIMYSQTSSNGYTTTIPLSGSGRISRYDNDSISGVSYYTFEVIGTASIENNNIPEQQVFSYDINPSEQLVQIGTDPAYDVTNGVITYSSSFDTAGVDLSNFQRLNLQTSIPTTYIYDTNGVRDEMTLILSLVSGSTNIPFNFKDLQLRVHRTGDRVSDLGSVIGEGWLNFVSPGFIGQKQSTDTPRLNTNNQIQITVDWEMEAFLRRKGVYQKGGDAKYKNPELLSLEWILIADSGDYIFKGYDEVKWTLSGSMKNSERGVPQAVFFPDNHPKSFTPAKISTIGALDHIFATDNTASAPYWVFGSELTPSVSTGNNILYMSSSNMNEAYGTGYKQGDLPYIPGPSPYFPGGVEPLGTQFDIIEFPLEIYPQDEIRFANNEEYSYTILEVEPPQNNIMNGVGRIKITLDRNVPGDVNKDFFLIRRNIPDASSIYMGTTFPYQNPPSASTSPGILFPEYPSLELEASASLIVTNLISKGVIT